MRRMSLMRRMCFAMFAMFATFAMIVSAACGAPTLEVGTPFTVAHTGPSHGATAIDSSEMCGPAPASSRDKV